MRCADPRVTPTASAMSRKRTSGSRAMQSNTCVWLVTNCQPASWRSVDKSADNRILRIVYDGTQSFDRSSLLYQVMKAQVSPQPTRGVPPERPPRTIRIAGAQEILEPAEGVAT